MRITLYMFRSGTELSVDVLREGAKFREVSVRGVQGATWRLFVHPGRENVASWVENVRPIVVDDPLADLKTRSSSGVLLAEVDERLFAVTFGHGYHAPDPKLLQRGFGLRVTANTIAKVSSADTRGLSSTGRSQKTILPTASELYALGIEPSEEWVRQLGGEVDQKDFATTAAGADSLRLTIKDFSLNDLPDKLRQILERYESTEYTRRFAFIDNFIGLDRKDEVVRELDEQVDTLLRARDSSIFFAAPDPFEQSNVDYHIVQYRKQQRIEQLTQAEVFAALDQLKLPQDIAHRVRISAYDDNGVTVDKQHELYDYIQVEVPRSDGRYVLTAGRWFRVSNDYVEDIHRRVAIIEDRTDVLNLPTWKKKELSEDESDHTAEGSYNKIVAKRPECALLDKKNFYIGGPSQKVEICDVLTVQKELICVKIASSSSTLSHLFSQGSVSASLMHIPDYQARVLDHLAELDPDPEFGERGDWTFVYAIATEKDGPLSQNLFFFSQVNLVNHYDLIDGRGYNVALAKIEVEE